MPLGSVLGTGLEPVRPCGHWILSPTCLPIPPPKHQKKRDYSLFIDWSERRDSNSRPPPWQGDALPAELLSLNVLRSLIKTFGYALTPPWRKLLSLDVAYFKERFPS